ncbi:hypothetical protein F2Q68_00023726 [Brassica cretica]|uniref:Uncharacterized protein n=1 Tax=Brassica cretica TaxID=69181 RepID=A0A8S9IBC9_BRACR|nr:hypothetical protein F2Q68_00023726 [Brassica cretica]
MPIFNWRGLFLIRWIVSNIPAVGFEAVVGSDKLKSSEPEKRVKSSGNGDDKNKKQGDNETNSTSKLHQLLDTKPRADGVAAR